MKASHNWLAFLKVCYICANRDAKLRPHNGNFVARCHRSKSKLTENISKSGTVIHCVFLEMIDLNLKSTETKFPEGCHLALMSWKDLYSWFSNSATFCFLLHSLEFINNQIWTVSELQNHAVKVLKYLLATCMKKVLLLFWTHLGWKSRYLTEMKTGLTELYYLFLQQNTLSTIFL